jgi:hypothetical protein
LADQAYKDKFEWTISLAEKFVPENLVTGWSHLPSKFGITILTKKGHNQDLNLAEQKYEILTGHKNYC